MANVYKAIVNVGGSDTQIVEASTPAALGTEIGKLITADTVDGTTTMYEVRGPLSRRMTEDLANQ